MGKETNVPQNTIVCRECGEIIDIAYGSEGVKVLYGICEGCRASENK
ncbi:MULTISPECIES: GapA-binding peptide SR1P [Bacillaceae]|nr:MULTISPECIES: GapA-binding peptide SR1P [Bacillus]MCA1017140.1 GapA-binding peptide SR1P [Bacillus stratosphericus]MBU8652879.1 GapA-binding peptide SR1P [Bacillus altitudinis]MBU8777927.1 GapA-binding peptide SR1P [Bacillus altitudinis]MCY7455048.1 GapA-binding peptide SR1P [Bacillus altitudinis]MCY7496545.1 GapA-binding peptide SR1P [Bacillus altitudinis]